MGMGRLSRAISVLVCLLMMGGICAAQEYSLPGLAGPDTVERGYYLALGLRKYINSFSSYQFPNYPPSKGPQDPVSRLEHPWDQVWGLARLAADLRTVAVNVEVAYSLSSYTPLKIQDSDWSDKNNPGQKTTFSQSEDRPSGWTLDISASAPLPPLPILRGVIGFRAQQFKFDAYDDLQGNIWDDKNSSYVYPTTWTQGHGLSGELIQYYNHYYAGGVAQGLMPLGVFSERLASTSLLAKLQGDCAYVTAKNADYHYFRKGDGTFDDTTGWSWHVNLAIGISVRGRLRLDLEGDFIRIRTEGTHTEYGIPWDGAKVWSDQQYVTITGGYTF